MHQLARLYKATARGPALFAPVLVAEEITDRLQRETVNDETVHPLVRMVNRIHVVEEARHVRFAREEVARQMAERRPGREGDQQPRFGGGGVLRRGVVDQPGRLSHGRARRDEAVRAARTNPN